MKRSKFFYAFVVTSAALALSTEIVLAMPPNSGSDQMSACDQQRGIWQIYYRFTNPPVPEICSATLNGVAVIRACGHCFIPNFLDCFSASGTWHSATAVFPHGYCTLPNGQMQTNNVSQPGGTGYLPGGSGNSNGGDGVVGVGSGGVDCGKYGLVSNGSGGCRPLNICDYEPTALGCNGNSGVNASNLKYGGGTYSSGNAFYSGGVNSIGNYGAVNSSGNYSSTVNSSGNFYSTGKSTGSYSSTSNSSGWGTTNSGTVLKQNARKK